MSKPARKAEPDYPGAGRRNCSLQLEANDVRGLRTIMGWMLTDPEHEQSKVGHQSAVKYAIAHTLKHPPAHVRGNRG